MASLAALALLQLLQSPPSALCRARLCSPAHIVFSANLFGPRPFHKGDSQCLFLMTL